MDMDGSSLPIKTWVIIFKEFAQQSISVVHLHVQVVTGAGLAIGWTAVRLFIPKDAGRGSLATPRVDTSAAAAGTKASKKEEPVVVVDPAEEEVGRMVARAFSAD